MKALLGELPRDSEARVIYGDPRKGCRHCGHVARKVAANGKAVLFHPGVECCAAALAEQVAYRQGEIDLRQRRIEAHVTELDRLEETLRAYGESRSAVAAEAKLRVEKAQRGIGHQIKALEEEIEEIAEELADVRRKLHRLERTS